MILKQLIKYDNAPALEATWVDENDVVIKCQAYANSQMDMLRADLGADAAKHEALIAEIEATYVPPPPIPFDRQAASVQIDEAVAEIYGRFTRFQLEYTEREMAAQAYKDAGYMGDIPARITEFSVPAGIPARNAADLILSQAINLRNAQAALSALRMRKYEVLRAPSDAQAKTVAAEILAAIAVVGANVQ